ncbi:MAG: hypothetical protein KDA22_02740 [Phycisphaerales bacterium]|nr:hypothetical protein [Phycisphaerales bacterium]
MTRRRAVTIVVLVVAVAAAGLWIAADRPPTWYAPPASDDAVAAEVGGAFEHRLVSTVSRVRSDEEPWAVRISEEQVNAWLATRLPAWLRHVGAEPPEQAPQVRLLDGAFVLAAPLGRRMVSATIAPELRDAGLRFEIGGAALGAIPLPVAGRERIAALARTLLGGADDEAARTALALLEGRPLAPTQTLGDGRTVELLAIEVHDGEVLLQFRTVRASPTSRP